MGLWEEPQTLRWTRNFIICDAMVLIAAVVRFFSGSSLLSLKKKTLSGCGFHPFSVPVCVYFFICKHLVWKSRPPLDASPGLNRFHLHHGWGKCHRHSSCTFCSEAWGVFLAPLPPSALVRFPPRSTISYLSWNGIQPEGGGRDRWGAAGISKASLAICSKRKKKKKDEIKKDARQSVLLSAVKRFNFLNKKKFLGKKEEDPINEHNPWEMNLPLLITVRSAPNESLSDGGFCLREPPALLQGGKQALPGKPVLVVFLCLVPADGPGRRVTVWKDVCRADF